jgi:hypothetical protein
MSPGEELRYRMVKLTSEISRMLATREDDEVYMRQMGPAFIQALNLFTQVEMTVTSLDFARDHK